LAVFLEVKFCTLALDVLMWSLHLLILLL